MIKLKFYIILIVRPNGTYYTIDTPPKEYTEVDAIKVARATAEKNVGWSYIVMESHSRHSIVNPPVVSEIYVHDQHKD